MRCGSTLPRLGGTITRITRIVFVISKNLNRRHMSDSQRAMLAAELANISNGGDRRSQDQSARMRTENHPVTQQEAAEMMDVGKSNIFKAKQVVRDGVPELVDAVNSIAAKMTSRRFDTGSPPRR